MVGLLVGLLSHAGLIGLDPVSDIAGVLISPIQGAVSSATRGVEDFFAYFTEYERLYNENEELKAQVRDLNARISELERYRPEVERLRILLDLKERHDDFEFVSAQVVASDLGNFFTVFTIDAGTVAGVRAGQPVITNEGLVGYVTEAGLTWAKVSTIIESDVTVGAISARSRDTGIVEGSFKYRDDGLCVMSLISKNASIIRGDTIETSGLGGNYPKGLTIGTVSEIALEPHGLSQYALIKPSADLSMLREVFVITDFTVGQTYAAADTAPQGADDEVE